VDKLKTIVLVVEDAPTVRALAVSIIDDDLGCTSLSAATAREAIALLEQDQPIDLLFADVNLPDGPRQQWMGSNLHGEPSKCVPA